MRGIASFNSARLLLVCGNLQENVRRAIPRFSNVRFRLQLVRLAGVAAVADKGVAEVSNRQVSGGSGSDMIRQLSSGSGPAAEAVSDMVRQVSSNSDEQMVEITVFL